VAGPTRSADSIGLRQVRHNWFVCGHVDANAAHSRNRTGAGLHAGPCSGSARIPILVRGCIVRIVRRRWRSCGLCPHKQRACAQRSMREIRKLMRRVGRPSAASTSVFYATACHQCITEGGAERRARRSVERVLRVQYERFQAHTVLASSKVGAAGRTATAAANRTGTESA
jgi:hypothetical protein